MISLGLTIYALTCLLALVHAVPLVLRDVIDPPITSPNASTVWTVGQTVTVTWNMSGLPTSSSTGMVVLGYSTYESENLDIDNPLAQNFSLSDQQVSFVLPPLVTRNNYIMVLFGDSGNASPNFTIIGSNSSSSPTTSPSPPATSSSTTSPSPSPSLSPPASPSLSPSGNNNTPAPSSPAQSPPTNASGDNAATPTPSSSGSSSASSGTPSPSAAPGTFGDSSTGTSAAWSWKNAGLIKTSSLVSAVLAAYVLL